MNEERVVWVTEDEAARLWKRAAELQVEASRRVEERSRALHPPPGEAGFPAGQHLPMADVLAAAMEVGIDEEFLETAVSELQQRRAAGEAPPPDFIERCAARFFGSPPGTLEVNSRIRASAAEVYGILQRLLPAEPYRLRLRGTLGDDPLKDGVLVFDAPESAVDPDSYTRRVLMAEDRVRRLFVTLRPAVGEGGRECRVTVRAPVDADPEPAFWVGSLVTGAATGMSGGLGALAGTGLGLAGAAVALPGAAVAMAGGSLAYWSYRSRYVRPLLRSQHGLQELLEVLGAAVKTRGAFLPLEGRSGAVGPVSGRTEGEGRGGPAGPP